jgi:hypothetical protein
MFIDKGIDSALHRRAMSAFHNGQSGVSQLLSVNQRLCPPVVNIKAPARRAAPGLRTSGPNEDYRAWGRT